MDKHGKRIKVLDIVYCPFPTSEGGTLVHYCLVTGIEERIAGSRRVEVVYGTSKKVDENTNKDPKGKDFVITPVMFGHGVWAKTGLTLKQGMVGTRFQCNRKAVFDAEEVETVGCLDINSSPAAFNALRKAMLNANY